MNKSVDMKNSPAHKKRSMMKFLLLSLLLFVVHPHGRFLMSAVINMTNHFKLSLVPWYVPFEATLQAQLGAAHPLDLIHKHRIISPNYPLVLIIHRQHLLPPVHVLRTEPCRTDLYCFSEERRRFFFFISRAERDLNDSPV